MAKRYIRRSLEPGVKTAAREFPAVVLAEITRTLTHRGVCPRVYSWRTSAGGEVDIVVETDSRLVPVEVKLWATPRPPVARYLKTFQADFRGKAAAGYVIHLGDMWIPPGEDVTALPSGEL